MTLCERTTLGMYRLAGKTVFVTVDSSDVSGSTTVSSTSEEAKSGQVQPSTPSSSIAPPSAGPLSTFPFMRSSVLLRYWI